MLEAVVPVGVLERDREDEIAGECQSVSAGWIRRSARSRSLDLAFRRSGVGCDRTNYGGSIVSRYIAPLKLFAGAVPLALASITVACTQAPGNAAGRRVPLPQDSFDATPARSNCYPDINHRASYPTGDFSKDKPTQPK